MKRPVDTTQRPTPFATLLAGLLAIVAMIPLSHMARRLGLLQIDFGRLLGTFVGPWSQGTQSLGWGMHIASGSLFAVVYRELFYRLGARASSEAGGCLGFAHALLALALFALLPHIHPRPRQAGLRSFAPSAYGPLTLPGILVGHVLYGAIVGWFLDKTGTARG